MNSFFLKLDLNELISSQEMTCEVNGKQQLGIFVPYAGNVFTNKGRKKLLCFSMRINAVATSKAKSDVYNIKQLMNSYNIERNAKLGVKYKPIRCGTGFANSFDSSNKNNLDKLLE